MKLSNTDFGLWLLIILGIVTFGSLAVYAPSEASTKRQALYCEMVQTFIATEGEYGWPDYRERYHQDCMP